MSLHSLQYPGYTFDPIVVRLLDSPMPRILIVGATGYVGRALALSLVRSGNHIVYGLARSEAKAKSLAQDEIIPVLCPDFVADSSPFLDTIEKERISVVVACGADQEAGNVLGATLKAGSHRLETLKSAGQVVCPKLGFIYTSGTWVHGSSLDMVSDLDPAGTSISATQPPSLVAWRTSLEQEVLKAKEVSTRKAVNGKLLLIYRRRYWT
jgi:hypothetical protein